MLTGKKTYLVSLLIIAHAVISYLTGRDVQFDIQQVLEGLGLAALRAGVKSDAGKTLAAILLASFSPLLLCAAPAEKDWFRAKEIQLEAFALERTPDFESYTGGYGVGASYFFTRCWGAGARVSHIGYDIEAAVVEDVTARLIARLPIEGGLLRVAPYIGLGAGTGLQRGGTHLNAAFGCEWRFTRRQGLFAEAELQANLSGRNVYGGFGGWRLNF